MNTSNTKSWTTRDVATYLGTVTPVVRYLANQGLLPVVVIHDRCWRFDPDAIMQAAKQLGLTVEEDRSEQSVQS